MGKGSKLMLLIIFIFFSISIVAKYYKYIVLQDYWLSVEVACDPETESCFTYECNYFNDQGCEPYKYMFLKAYTLEERIQKVEDIFEFECEANDSTCETIECTSDEVVVGEFCTQW